MKNKKKNSFGKLNQDRKKMANVISNLDKIKGGNGQHIGVVVILDDFIA